MPTGYTADIAKDISFEQYAMGCARAFGALVMMRDEPADAPIPEAFQPSDYHLRAGDEARAKLARLQAMSIDDVQREADAAHQRTVDAREKSIRECLELRNKYSAMLAKVVQWTAPTPEHEEFKNFMADQIRRSIDFDCNDGYYRSMSTEKPEPTAWHNEQIKKAQADIDYHEKGYREEVERTNSRNAWVAALRKSLAASS